MIINQADEVEDTESQSPARDEVISRDSSPDNVVNTKS